MAAVDAHFGFSRYAEQLGRSASSFDDLYNELLKPYTYIDRILIQGLKYWLSSYTFDWVALSVPFPGNLYSALRCGEYIKKNYPPLLIMPMSAFVNTQVTVIAVLFAVTKFSMTKHFRSSLKWLLALQKQVRISSLRRI